MNPSSSTAGLGTKTAIRMGALLITQPGWETTAVEERGDAGDWEFAPGVALRGLSDQSVSVSVSEPPGGWCFPQLYAGDAWILEAPSVNALARSLADNFCERIRSERVEGAWPCLFRAAVIDGLQAHASVVEREFLRLLKERIARVARLATDELPRGPWGGRGFLVAFLSKGRVGLAYSLRAGGQRRMADDPSAPSRSYLKIEEAFVVLGSEPAPGETVVDLGAAPGGWSYSAAKRGASVVAIDNGPLKGGALGNARIDHRREDAFGYFPPSPVDWLFCDLVDDPDRVWDLVLRWLERGWCRRFVVNLKFGRTNPHRLLDRVRDERRGLPRWCGTAFRIRHLTHDREEFTLVGEVSGMSQDLRNA